MKLNIASPAASGGRTAADQYPEAGERQRADPQEADQLQPARRRQVDAVDDHPGQADQHHRRQGDDHARRQLHGEIAVARQGRGPELADPAGRALGGDARAAGGQGRAHGAVGRHRHQQVGRPVGAADASARVVDVGVEQVDAQREGDREQQVALADGLERRRELCLHPWLLRSMDAGSITSPRLWRRRPAWACRPS
jgi:hypothetical protein